MTYLDKKDPLATWKSATTSLISSRRGKNQPTLLKVDKLMKTYGEATEDDRRLGVCDTLFFVLHKWLSDYSGGRAAAARELLAEVTAKRKFFTGRGVTARWIPIPEPDYPEFLARNKNSGDKYFTLGMLKDGGLGKDLGGGSLVHSRQRNEATPEAWRGLTYMNESQRQRFLIEVRNGLLCHAGGAQVDTRTSHITKNKVGNNIYIFVMDGNGRIFSAAKQDVEHHSSFLSGNPSAAAGGIKVTAGKLEYVNANSGHYCPMKEDIDQFIAELASRGVDMRGVELDKMQSRMQKQAAAKGRDIRERGCIRPGPGKSGARSSSG